MEKTDGEGYYRSKGGDGKSSIHKKEKGASLIHRVIVLLIAFLILSALFLGPIMDFFYGPWGIGRVYPEKADYTIQRNIDFQNIGTTKVEYYNLTLAIPEDIPGNDMQYIDDIDWNIEPEIFRKYSSKWKYWNRSLDQNQKESVQINYSVRTNTVSWDYSDEQSGTVNDISEDLKLKYNKNQWQLNEDRNGDGEKDWMIQPEHPEIKKLAEEIVEGEDNVYDKSRAIFDWIDKNIEYEIGGPGLPKHAAWVLENETGDCDEQSFLYASLSRAVGIPAWMELGVLYDRVGQRWEGHGWIRTKFVSENGLEGWVNIDLVNDQFYFRDALRFTTWVDDGEEGHLEDFYSYIRWMGGNLEIVDDFDDIKMDTEGRVVPYNGSVIPGFKIKIGVPAVVTSFVLHSITCKKKKVPTTRN